MCGMDMCGDQLMGSLALSGICVYQNCLMMCPSYRFPLRAQREYIGTIRILELGVRCCSREKNWIVSINGRIVSRLLVWEGYHLRMGCWIASWGRRTHESTSVFLGPDDALNLTLESTARGHSFRVALDFLRQSRNFLISVGNLQHTRM